MHGLLVVDKPAGCTSHDVVARCRRIVGQKRVGHAGTLDPGATGVLLVALGRATRLMRFVSELPKRYVGEVVLGSATSTLDDEGDVVGTWEMGHVTVADAQQAAVAFQGEIEQIPPMVSALKVGGKRLHELARAGIEVERAPRRVFIHSFEVAEGPQPGVLRIDVTCSPGTYVRTLAADLGTALGGGAHLRRLRRLAIGPFTTDQAVPLSDLEATWQEALQPPAAMVGHLSHRQVEAEVVQAIRYGQEVSQDRLGTGTGTSEASTSGEGPWALFDPAGQLVAVYERADNGGVRSGVVLAAD